MRIWHYSVVIAALAASGCGNTNENSKPDISAMQLENRISNVEQGLKELRETVALQTYSKQAWLRLSDSGFTPLPTDIGTLTVQLLKIEAAGAGSRVILDIGNPTDAEITKLSLSGSWGKTKPDGTIDFSSSNNYNTVINLSIKKAAFTRINFVIDSAKPNELGFISIEKSSVDSLQMNR